MHNQLSSLDAFFLHGETPNQAMNLTGVGIYDPSMRSGGKIDFGAVMDYGRERTKRSPLFRRRLVTPPFNIDQPYWAEDPHFDCQNHIFHSVLPSPGTREQLNAEVARVHALPIDRTGPLWEWWFVEGLNAVDGHAPGSFALLFKLHHAAFDGVSGWEVINVSHDEHPDALELTLDAGQGAEAAPTPYEAPDWVEMTRRSITRTLGLPTEWMRTVYESQPILRKMLSESPDKFPLITAKAPRTVFNGSLQRDRVHRKVPVDLGDIKKMRALVPGSTVNDAVLAIISGALRAYLEQRGALPDSTLIVGVPISIRAKGDEGDAGNQAILALLPLATDIEDPVERLRIIHHWTSTKKEYVSDIPASLITKGLDFTSPILTDMAVRIYTGLQMADTVTLPYNLIVTNVPASRVPLYFAGSKMIEYDACGPIWQGAGLIHAITSYCSDLAISFDACETHLPDPDVYSQCIVASRDALLEAAS